MLLLDTISQFVALDPARRAGPAAELCHRNALEHCAEGNLLKALAFSRAAKRLERLSANVAALQAGAISPATFDQISAGLMAKRVATGNAIAEEKPFHPPGM